MRVSAWSYQCRYELKKHQFSGAYVLIILGHFQKCLTAKKLKILSFFRTIDCQVIDKASQLPERCLTLYSLCIFPGYLFFENMNIFFPSSQYKMDGTVFQLTSHPSFRHQLILVQSVNCILGQLNCFINTHSFDF